MRRQELVATAGGRLYLSGGFGTQIQPVRDRFVNNAGPTVWARAIKYPAVAVNTSGAVYGTSRDAGARALIEFLNTLPSCAVQPMVILAGHSQGADAIQWALLGAQNLPVLSQSARLLIKAVILYGDPTWLGGNWITHAPNSPGGRGIFPKASSTEQALANNYRVYGWPYMSTNPNPQWFSKIRSWCYLNDWACQNGNPFDERQRAIHNSYKNQAQSTYEWARYMIANVN